MVLVRTLPDPMPPGRSSEYDCDSACGAHNSGANCLTKHQMTCAAALARSEKAFRKKRLRQKRDRSEFSAMAALVNKSPRPSAFEHLGSGSKALRASDRGAEGDMYIGGSWVSILKYHIWPSSEISVGSSWCIIFIVVPDGDLDSAREVSNASKLC